MEHQDIPLQEIPVEEMVTVFIGDLQNCRERLLALEEHEIPAVVVGDVDGTVPEQGAPVLELRVYREDLEDVIDLFEQLWQETLELSGLEAQHDGVVDLSQDIVVCPGCQSEISEVTAEGECPECGLFLGFPPEDEESEVSNP
ncbi:MAG: hypothetical protein H6727_09145 [Myxococcales bacterium]|nr:hypothetical protein [Myxococcales bacterium]